MFLCSIKIYLFANDNYIGNCVYTLEQEQNDKIMVKISEFKMEKEAVIYNISEAMSYCIERRLIVYPIKVGNNWYIEVEFKSVKHQFKTPLKKDKITEAVNKTYSHFYNKRTTVR